MRVLLFVICLHCCAGWVVLNDHKLDDDLLAISCGGPNMTCASDRGCVNDTFIYGSAMVCLHKSLCQGPHARDVVGAFVLFGAGVLAGASGIGGGGLNVPLAMLLFNFILEEAVPLSHVMVLGNAIAQNTINFRRKHPKASRPLIDFDVPLLLLPPLLGGNSIGILISRVLPVTGVKILAVLLLIFAGTKTTITARKTYAKETKESDKVKVQPQGGLTSSRAVSLLGEPEPLASDHAR